MLDLERGPAEEIDLDAVFRALANEGRRSMLDQLSDGPASLGDLAAPLDMTLSAVDQHARTLERCGLIRTEKRGRVRYCRLNAPTMNQAERWIATRRALWERRLDRLGDTLDTTDPETP